MPRRLSACQFLLILRRCGYKLGRMERGRSPHYRYTTPLAKLRMAAIALAAVIGFGTVGLMILEKMKALDALYMTVITLSTVGFGEIRPLHDSGRVFVIFLILFGVAIGGFIASAVGQYILEGQFREMFGRRKMEQKIRQMSNHYIIAGFGRVGRHVAAEFERRGIPFLIIEKDNEAVHQIYNLGYLFVQGEATDDDVLREAKIEEANTLISTLPDEAQNVYLTLTARDMCPKLNIIARADYEEGVKKLRRAGANHVVSPHVLGGIRMAMASLSPNVVDFMHSTSLGEGGLTIEEIEIPEGSKFIGKSLVESGLKKEYNVTVIGLRKPGKSMEIAPGTNMVFEANDIVILIGRYDDLERLGKNLSK